MKETRNKGKRGRGWPIIFKTCKSCDSWPRPSRDTQFVPQNIGCAMEEEYSFLIEEAKKSFALPFKDVFVSQIGRTHPLVFTI